MIGLQPKEFLTKTLTPLKPELASPHKHPVGTGKAISFVVGMMSDDLLALKDDSGCNALHVAAEAGNTAAARILVGKFSDLLYVKSNSQSSHFCPQGNSGVLDFSDQR